MMASYYDTTRYDTKNCFAKKLMGSQFNLSHGITTEKY